MTTDTSAKATLHHRAMHEVKELATISAYLYVTLGAVILMKTAVLGARGRCRVHSLGHRHRQGRCTGEVLMLGDLVHLGGRRIREATGWPTLRRAFSVLVLLCLSDHRRGGDVGCRASVVAAWLASCSAHGWRRRWPLSDHAPGADPVLRLPRAQRGARRRRAGADVLVERGQPGIDPLRG